MDIDNLASETLEALVRRVMAQTSCDESEARSLLKWATATNLHAKYGADTLAKRLNNA